MIERAVFYPKGHQTLNISEEKYENSVKVIPVLTELANKKEANTSPIINNILFKFNVFILVSGD